MSAHTPSTTSAGGYCYRHGIFTGFTCPMCGMTSVPSPAPQATALDPTPALMRIAAALERIATRLEREEARE